MIETCENNLSTVAFDIGEDRHDKAYNDSSLYGRSPAVFWCSSEF